MKRGVLYFSTNLKVGVKTTKRYINLERKQLKKEYQFKRSFKLVKNQCISK